MKEPEFIELLNLYLDHEISVADAARLEAEVQANPARRQIYQQYCRMQKACSMVAADFQTEPRLAAEIARKVVPFNPELATARRKRASGIYAVGTFAAAAACLAVVFINRDSTSAPSVTAPEAAMVQTAPAAQTDVASPAVIEPARAPSGPRGLVSLAKASQDIPTGSALVPNTFFLTAQSAPGTMVTSGAAGSEQLAWISAIQLAPLPQRTPLEDLRFDTRPVSLRPEGRALGGSRVTNDAEESIAFRIRK
jgi:hypothetical protein